MTLTFPTPDATAEARAREYLTQARNQALVVPDMPADIQPLPVQHSGIIGAGTLGSGIARNFANIGLPVTLVEHKPEARIRELATRLGITQRSIEPDEILRRCLLPMINEGVLLLERGLAQRASDIDVIWAYGFGFPAARGGPMYLADPLGLPRTLAELDLQSAQNPKLPRAAGLLRQFACSGQMLAGF